MRVLEFSVTGQQIEREGIFRSGGGQRAVYDSEILFRPRMGWKSKSSRVPPDRLEDRRMLFGKNHRKLLHRENRGAAREKVVRERSRTGKRRNEVVNKQDRSEAGGMT